MERGSGVPMSSLNELGVLESSSWQLRESVAERSDALSLHLEATLLGHGSIPTAFEKMLRRSSLI